MPPPPRTHLALRRRDRLRYFGPSLFLGYLAALCLALTLVSASFTTLPNPGAIIATGVLGTALTTGLTTLIFRVQRRDLRYRSLATSRGADDNFAIALTAIKAAGWTIAATLPGQSIDVEISGTFLSRGEMISIVFLGPVVNLAAICDPQVGFSLAGRRRCRQHLALIVAALGSAPAGSL